MLMQGVLNATDVRKEWGKFIDTVIHERPGIVKRNRDHFLALSIMQAKALLENYHFKARLIQEDDGSITATLENFDLAVNASDRYSARKALAEELIEYANEYFEQFPLYFNSTNRQSHFPYMLAVSLQENLDGVLGLISA
ncbi:MAG TPA: hypothetical protein DEF36_03375 [Desulfotomaculum sp.]|nr:hypothetical protein [Desulfotomaculum sp.]